MKPMYNLNQNSECPGQDSNRTPPEYARSSAVWAALLSDETTWLIGVITERGLASGAPEEDFNRSELSLKYERACKI
jgi:hypothetical protein